MAIQFRMEDRCQPVLNIPCAVKHKIYKENILHIPFIAFLPLSMRSSADNKTLSILFKILRAQHVRTKLKTFLIYRV